MSKRRYLEILLLAGLCWIQGCRSGQSGEPTLFSLIAPGESGISFANTLTETDSLNIIQYLYYYNGGGVACGDLNKDGLPDLFFTANQAPNQLYLNQGNLQFENISAKAGISDRADWSTGVTMADVNGDGWLDLYVCNVGQYKGLQATNRLYINNGPGDSGVTFSEQAAQYSLDFQGFATQAAFFDYDLDGDLDCYLLCHSVHATGAISDTARREVRDPLAGDRLLRNDGSGFTDVSAQAGIKGGGIGYGLGIAISDLNQDGYPDIYVGNDFYENDYLYYNNGDGTFTESFATALGHCSQFSMGNDIADINNDGWPDILTLDMKPESEQILKRSVGADAYDAFEFKRSYGFGIQYPRNSLQLNRGRLADDQVLFSDIAPLLGIEATDWSWTPLLADFDNNGLVGCLRGQWHRSPTQ